MNDTLGDVNLLDCSALPPGSEGKAAMTIALDQSIGDFAIRSAVSFEFALHEPAKRIS